MAKITTNFPSFESLINTMEEYQPTISDLYSVGEFLKSPAFYPQNWLGISMDNSKMEVKFTDGHALLTGLTGVNLFEDFFSKNGKHFDIKNFASMEISLKNMVVKVQINANKGFRVGEITDGVNTISVTEKDLPETIRGGTLDPTGGVGAIVGLPLIPVQQKVAPQEKSSFYSNINSQMLISEISPPSNAITLVSSFHVNNSKYQFDIQYESGSLDGIDIGANLSEGGTFGKLLRNQKTVDFLKGILDENNTVLGTDGSEYLFSFDGNDEFDAKKGNDYIDAGNGNDTLVGGQGVDKLTGGKGADVFKYTSLKDSGITTSTRDTTTDFKTSEGDKIDLSLIDANEKLTGDQAFTFIGSAAFSKTNASGQLRFDATSKILYGSTDADTTPEFSIQLSGVKSLASSDFIL